MNEAGWTRTTCPYCGVGCGVLARSRPDGTAEIKGDPDHPANYGRLCSKGSALGETLSLDDRLLDPIVDGGHSDWDAALDLVADRFRDTIAAHGPDSVAFYVSGQLLTEDYYVANKLMKGFIGSANIDTNSRLCMASSVAGHKRAFGSDTVPGTYRDIELADLVVLVGSNLAWCHPVLYQRLVAARRQRGTKVVVIDPRETATCEIADQHIQLAPGTDAALFNGLLQHLDEAGVIDEAYVSRFTSGLDQALQAVRGGGISQLGELLQVPTKDIEEFFRLFAATRRVVTVYSQGVNQSTSGSDKVNAIINCHLATGRIGQPGMGPLSVTGQPNAMGGREVGGLANMLAAHMEISDPDHRRIVQKFWKSPTIAARPGLKAVDLFQAVADGRVKALWVMATNPVDSLPDADAVRAALEACPFVVVSDVCRNTDTTVHADVLLPSLAWGEKDGTVTNSERRISRQRAFLPGPGNARADWWQICEVASRMGFAAALDYAAPAEIFREYAALTGVENFGTRDLDVSAYADITHEEYEDLKPFMWPRPAGTADDESRFFSNGGFFTADRKARFVATPYRAPQSQVSGDYPFVLNTGRLRDQWHTMTRTAKTPRLMNHVGEPFLEINPDDAERIGLGEATIVEIASSRGSALLRAVVTTRQRPGRVFAPMHWTDQLASSARVNALVAPNTDALSGQPELKFTPVSVRPFTAAWYAYAIAETRPQSLNAEYFALAPARDGLRLELAGTRLPEDWDDFAHSLFEDSLTTASEIVSYRDRAAGQFRFAVIEGGRLRVAFYAATTPVGVSRAWVTGLLGTQISATQRLRLLAGRPGPDQPDPGPTVCSCFEVGAITIADAIRTKGCRSVDAVGACTRAGTNCGSCRAEIARIVEENLVDEAVVPVRELDRFETV